MMRDVLGKGMLHHFMENELLGQIFEIDVEVSAARDRAGVEESCMMS